jgi:hypothetical protein
MGDEGKNPFLSNEETWVTGGRRETGFAVGWQVGPGVCAAASPGSGGQRREAFPSAGEQVGDRIADIESLGAMEQRKVNRDVGFGNKACSCCERIPGSARQSGSTPIFLDIVSPMSTSNIGENLFPVDLKMGFR